jgi:hypothetical protein
MPLNLHAPCVCRAVKNVRAMQQWGVTCDLSPWQLLLFSASGVRDVPVTSLAAAKLGPTCGLSIQGSPGFREPCLAKPITTPATYHITLLVLGPLCDRKRMRSYRMASNLVSEFAFLQTPLASHC